MMTTPQYSLLRDSHLADTSGRISCQYSCGSFECSIDICSFSCILSTMRSIKAAHFRLGSKKCAGLCLAANICLSKNRIFYFLKYENKPAAVLGNFTSIRCHTLRNSKSKTQAKRKCAQRKILRMRQCRPYSPHQLRIAQSPIPFGLRCVQRRARSEQHYSTIISKRSVSLSF